LKEVRTKGPKNLDARLEPIESLEGSIRSTTRRSGSPSARRSGARVLVLGQCTISANAEELPFLGHAFEVVGASVFEGQV
jgi:hypothetical protein